MSLKSNRSESRTFFPFYGWLCWFLIILWQVTLIDWPLQAFFLLLICHSSKLLLTWERKLPFKGLSWSASSSWSWVACFSQPTWRFLRTQIQSTLESGSCFHNPSPELIDPLLFRCHQKWGSHHWLIHRWCTGVGGGGILSFNEWICKCRVSI